MVEGKMVRPQKWSKVLDLFDDGDYSAIWGAYDNAPTRCLGVRWNGARDNPNDKGFPNLGGNPLWYVEPYYVTKVILLELVARIAKDPSHGIHENILTALREYSCEYQKEPSNE